MTTFTIDTNAGPIVTREFDNAKACRRYCESMVPLLRKRGHTCEWTKQSTEGGRVWHVGRIFNRKHREVHVLAFTKGELR